MKETECHLVHQSVIRIGHFCDIVREIDAKKLSNEQPSS